MQKKHNSLPPDGVYSAHERNGKSNMQMTLQNRINIAVFASGSGTNAQNLIRYFRESSVAEVSLVLSNNPNAYVLQRAAMEKVPAVHISRDIRTSKKMMLNLLKDHDIDFIILAGYLLLIPAWLVEAFPHRIINIHPALLPEYGGKGMYGNHVHEAVLAAGEKKSGITIHYVNEYYDEGNVIFREECPVLDDDTVDLLADRIHNLEYRFFPVVAESVIKQQFDRS